MTDFAVRPPVYDLRSILGLALPAHVVAQIDGVWRPAWLISRVHCEDGWIGLIQYTDPTGHEHTRRVPAAQLGPYR